MLAGVDDDEWNRAVPKLPDHRTQLDDPRADADDHGDASLEPVAVQDLHHRRASFRYRKSSGMGRQRAGAPIARCQAGTSRVTMLPAATIAPSPMCTPGRIVAFAPT